MHYPLNRVSRRISRCRRCGGTIKASEAYYVQPELVDYISPRGRTLKVWTRPHFHQDIAICEAVIAEDKEMLKCVQR